MLLPATGTRATIALFITFFPYGIFYSAPYPVSELMTIAAWVWVFPSPLGCLAMAFLPLVMNATYGYFAFNLICIVTSLAVMRATLERRELPADLVASTFKTAKVCMTITISLCLLQIVTNPSLWAAALPGVAVAAGKGAGLRSEPSLLAGPLMVFLSLLALRIHACSLLGEADNQRTKIFRGGVVAMLLLVGATQSLSVLLVVVVFAPLLFLRRRHMAFALAGLVAGGAGAAIAFGDRIHDAVSSGGGFADMITVGVDSWRSIPDILVLINFSSYLWPGNPTEVRVKLSGFAVTMNPGLAWMQFTYSTFSACATTLGLVVTVVLFMAGLRMGMKHRTGSAGARATWVLLYIANWFLAPKYDVCGWVALGLLTWVGRLDGAAWTASDAAPVEAEWRDSTIDGDLPC